MQVRDKLFCFGPTLICFAATSGQVREKPPGFGPALIYFARTLMKVREKLSSFCRTLIHVAQTLMKVREKRMSFSQKESGFGTEMGVTRRHVRQAACLCFPLHRLAACVTNGA